MKKVLHRGSNRSAQITTRLIAFLLIALSIFAHFTWKARGFTNTPSYQYGWAMAIGVSVFISTFVFETLPISVYKTFTCLCLAFGLTAGSIQNIALASSSLRYEPFLAHKLIAILVAVLAPFLRKLGAFLIIASGVLAVSIYFFLIPPEFRERLPAPEPWTTVAFALISMLILFHRVREIDYERKLAETVLARRTGERLASSYLAIRDLVNTPLQTLLFASELLRRNHPEDAALINHMDRAIAKLMALNHELDVQVAESRQSLQSVSIDSYQIIRSER